MFMDELTNIDRAMAVDLPFAKFLRSSRRDNRNPDRLDVATKNPNAGRRHVTDGVVRPSRHREGASE